MNGFDIPKAPNAGDRISARFFQGIIDALQRLKPKAGDGVRLEYGRDGVTIHSKPGGVGGGKIDFGAFPFQVIDATTIDENSGARVAKVRVLPGVCNFSIPKVAGASNEFWKESSHAKDAPRINCSDLTLAGGFWVALEFSDPVGDSIFPDTVDTVATVDLATNQLPLARVVAKRSDNDEVQIESIRQLVFDVIGAHYVGKDSNNDTIWATTR